MLQRTKILENKNIADFTLDNLIELQEVLQYHSDLYYNQNTSEISDKQYDDLLKKLEQCEKKFSKQMKVNNIIKKSDTIWAELVESSFKKVKHSRPMISLGNTYNEEDLRDFDERVAKNVGNAGLHSLQETQYVLEFKFDWLWVELIYKKWKLTQAITRGNWVEWEDVTQNIFQIENIPKTIDYKQHLEVRGEVVMPISSFNMLNDEALANDTKVFSNPRNAASGSLRMKDNRVTKKRKLQFFVYDISNFWEFVEQEQKETYFDTIKDLEKLWFSISSYFELSENIGEIISKINNFWDIKKEIDFEIDGLVLKVNNIDLWEQIWYTQHHPRYCIAYKFPAEVFTTTILSVEHQVWRTGTITPVANLEPVNMWWAMIKRATLHNYEECEKLRVEVGDSVFIKRAWEVIPKITALAKKSPLLTSPQGRGITQKGAAILSPQGGIPSHSLGHTESPEGHRGTYILPPKACPSCGTQVLKDEEKVRFYCPNSEWCFEQRKHKLIYAVGKQGLNIDGFWKAQVEQFLKLELITDLYSIFTLEEKAEEILALEWFQEKSVDNLIKAINEKKKLDITTLLISLAISWVWKATAKELAKLFVSEENLLNFDFSLEDLENLEDIWPEIAQNVVSFFTTQKNKILLEKLVNILNISYYKEKIVENTSNIFYNKKACITWSFENYKRPDLVKMLENIWWKFVSSVSKNTDFLIAWEKAWSKLKKANELWIRVLNVEEFLEEMK